MTAFRAWWFNRPPTAQLPLIRVHLEVVWGNAPYQKLWLPVDRIPALRISKWETVHEVIKSLVTHIRKVARENGRLYWRRIDEEFWRNFADNTLPEIVKERAGIIGKARDAKRAKWEAKRKETANTPHL